MPNVEELLLHRGWVEGLARRLVRDPDDAADVAQQAWVRILSRPPGPRRSPRAWLAAVVRSAALDRWRSERSRASRERGAAPPGPAPSTADLVARADAHRLLLEEVLRLEPAAREVVLLRFFEGLAPEEIARRLARPGGTVRSRLHRALDELRARLDRAHGGDRAAWALAMLGPGPLVKGAIEMTLRQKAAVAAAALLLLVGAVAALRDREEVPGAAPRPGPPASEAIASPAPASDAPAAPQAPGEGAAAPVAPAAPASPPPAAPEFVRLEAVLLAPREPEPGPDSSAEVTLGGGAAQDPGGDDGEEAGRGAGMAMVGWTKWKPIPERGTATLRGRVVDLHGRPLPGAQVWLAEGGGIVDRLGETGGDGRFELPRRPARAHRLFGDFCGVARHAAAAAGGVPEASLVLVEPREGQTIGDIELRVPVDRDRLGSIAGRVVDDEGQPVRCTPACGMQDTRPDREGRFRFASVPAGDAEVTVDDFGFRRWRRVVAVRAGETTEVEIVLQPTRAGTQEIGGRVRDDAGNPVRGVPVWCGGVDGVSRETVSGAEGAFLFRRLPTPGEGESFSVSVYDFGEGEHAPYLPATVQGVLPPDRRVEVVLRRTALLRIVVRDAPSGEILPLFNVSVEHEVPGDGGPRLVPIQGATLHEEDGAWEVDVPRTRVVLFVEAPDHVPSHLAVDVPAEGGRFEVAVDMAR